MKIAVFHNFLDNIGGAEKVSLTLARNLGADIYSTSIDKDKIHKMGFKKINLISIGGVPINAPFRQQVALQKFRNLDLNDKYDFFIISGDWAMSAAVINKPNLWYVHSPIREIWDLYHFTRENSVPWYGRNIFDVWVKYNRYLNRKYITHVENIICNSENTQERVSKFLKKSSLVIHPPIETKQYFYKKNGDFWLSVNRLISHKRIEMQLEAFRNLPEEKLVIVGSFEKSRHFLEYAQHIKLIKPNNVKIISWVDSKDLIDLYADCKGFICTAQDEDFGMAAVEAMASGKPVIAPNEGGYRETVVDGKTGKLIDNIDVEKLIEAIKEIGTNPGKYKSACLKSSKKFDTKEFIRKIKKEIEKKDE